MTMTNVKSLTSNLNAMVMDTTNDQTSLTLTPTATASYVETSAYNCDK